MSSAPHSRSMSFFSWLCVFGNQDHRAVTARARHHRKPDAGIAGGRLQHQPAGLELAALLGLQDHPFAGAVLHRLAGIHELGLAENGAAGRLGGALELDQRRVADRFDDVFVDAHTGTSWRFLEGFSTTLKDPSGSAQGGLGSTRLCEDDLSHVDIAGQESGLAIGEVVFPEPAEALVEAERRRGSARRCGNYCARSRASWHNLARKCARG